MPDTRLEQALDELYASDPAEFVAVRKRLVADLRASGDRAGADQCKAARRPSTSAWALNQVARREPELIESLLARSNELRAAQSRAGSGTLDTMQETIRAHRRALADATDAALAILGHRANDGFRNEIVSSLRAASTDADVGRQLALGRLVREAESASGFPDASHLTLVPEPPAPAPDPGPELRPARRSRAKPDPGERSAKRDRAREAEAAASAEREATRQADLALRDRAVEDAAAAKAEVSRAETKVRELETELDSARREIRDARARIRQATAEAARLEAKLH